MIAINAVAVFLVAVCRLVSFGAMRRFFPDLGSVKYSGERVSIYRLHYAEIFEIRIVLNSPKKPFLALSVPFPVLFFAEGDQVQIPLC